MKKIFLSVIFLSALCAACGKTTSPTVTTPIATTTSPTSAAPNPIPSFPVKSVPTIAALTEPITNPLSRVTKKPFGIYITPQTSPVQPEKFTGYHTGVDFETTPNEQNIDVPIFAACDGKLLMKKYASGYGGVAVQSCTLDGRDVTLIYGHLRLTSIAPNVGEALKTGEKFAVLGTGYSTETDGERKHLHFGIHIGTNVNILGYVQNQTELSGWLDPQKFLK